MKILKFLGIQPTYECSKDHKCSHNLEFFCYLIKDGKQNSFAFMLVEAGFDVYLANSRGNRYSREHVILKPNEPEFWKWSWQEMAKYDLPATIDIVLETSNKKNLYYIGHSQGKNSF